MPKFFFADPFAAAWMERQHGVRTENRENGYFSAWQVAYFESDWERSGEEPPVGSYRFHVLTECLPLLRPRPGDVVQWLIHDGRGRAFPGAGLFGLYEGTGEVESILRRDGKPFFWPESD